ncbi:hypothetical protein [Bradyrhizobium sp. JYMT SZCCT0428]|uniref:hypothetical protein n=1 Tax=Bradyrhizobium sp. JYMT SZCCT0428 TaxID=2807673 RepID=UPI001BA81C12|nr:hypothetical protein [Bradyrhizobium sp. JYMT SZCCT0428]MBR1151207.1 hypothetical protein [Bradyrhizobium sp. JYMT SZCCT0428]
MIDNVISIVGRLPSQRRADDPDQRSDAVEAKHSADEVRRLRQIEKRCNDSKGGYLRFQSREDRLFAAKALGQILKDSKKTIAYLKEEWSSAKGGGPFHLHRYMISPDLDLSDAKNRAAKADKLIGLARGYLERATFIAEASGQEVEQAKISLFRNTSIWRRPATLAKGDSAGADEAAENIALLLQELSRRIILRTDLMQLFHRMQRVPGTWDFRRNEFRLTGMACLFRTAYQEGYEHWTEAPPLPSVPLIRVWHAGWRLPVSLEATDHSSAQFTSPIDSEINLFREIRLAIGPTVKERTLGPMIESRAWVELTLFNEDGSEFGRWPLDPSCDLGFFESAGTYVDVQNARYRVSSELEILPDFEGEHAEMAAIRRGESTTSGSLWEHSPLTDEKQFLENYYFSWTPADGDHVAHWLGRQCNGRVQPVELLPQVSGKRVWETNWYPRFILGHFVYQAIVDGRLEAALLESVEVIRSAFSDYEARWLAELRDQTNELIVQLRDGLPSREN